MDRLILSDWRSGFPMDGSGDRRLPRIRQTTQAQIQRSTMNRVTIELN